MRSNPQPHEICTILDSQRPVMRANSHRPQLANFLEVQRRVRGILFQEVGVVSGHSLDKIPEGPHSKPKTEPLYDVL
ncbi:MAG TPA: hypothetical protein VFU48_07020 [Nitrospira sp.]|nr:hypothetical protein [Nitrospira sp.]